MSIWRSMGICRRTENSQKGLGRFQKVPEQKILENSVEEIEEINDRHLNTKRAFFQSPSGLLEYPLFLLSHNPLLTALYAASQLSWAPFAAPDENASVLPLANAHYIIFL